MAGTTTEGANRGMARRLFALACPHWGRLAAAAICLLISNGAFLAVPYVLRVLTDSVFVHHDTRALNRVTLLLLAVVAVTSVFSYARGYLIAYATKTVAADLRIAMYAHLQQLSLSFYDNRRTGEIMSRLTTDTTMIQTVVTDSLLALMQQVVTLLAVTVIVIVTDWRLAAVALTMAPLLIVCGRLVGRRTRTLSEHAQEQLADASTVLEETLSSVRVVRAFGREDYEMARFGDAVLRAFAATLATARLRALFDAVMTTASFGALALVLWVGGREVLASRLTPGGLISFLFYMTMLMGPLQGLASLYGSFQQALGGAARIFDLLDTVPEIVDAPDAPALPPVRGHLELRDVWFAYGEAGPPVLRGVSLEVEPGQTVALVGPSGAGKTTLVSLLPRFYEPGAGQILLDGRDISAVTVRSLRAAMAVVPQEPALFGGTVYQNIAYGRLEAGPDEVEAAARAANAHEFIAALPHGYNSLVGERGVKLSGGQRQRLAIARALLKNPRLLILDEATAALDNESEFLVQDALERLMVGRTTVVIAHRLTTVERADKIVVLDGGRVVEQGTHAELVQQGGLYHRLSTRDFTLERAPEGVIG